MSASARRADPSLSWVFWVPTQSGRPVRPEDPNPGQTTRPYFWTQAAQIPLLPLFATVPCAFLHYYVYNKCRCHPRAQLPQPISCELPETGHCFIIFCVSGAEYRVWPVEGARDTTSFFLCWDGHSRVPCEPGPGLVWAWANTQSNSGRQAVSLPLSSYNLKY